MNDLDLRRLRALTERRTGMVLGADKDYFVASRLEAAATREGLDPDALLAQVLGDPDGTVAGRTAESLLVGETTFFRDPSVFEALAAQVLPALIAARGQERALTAWCAGCSTGQEPYSLAMLLRERLPELASWRVQLLATDISSAALAAAREGLYGQLEVNRGLPARLLVKYFEREGVDWRLDRRIVEAVELRRLNLLEPWWGVPPLDLVLLRNVLIYFDVSVRRDLLRRVRSLLRPDGWLVLGAAESTVFLDDAFAPVPGAPGLYRLAQGRAASSHPERVPCT